MTIQAQTPDGMTHEFPDGTPDSVIDGAMKSYISSLPAPSLGAQIGADVRNSANEFGADYTRNQAAGHNLNAGVQATEDIGSGIGKIAGDIGRAVFNEIPGSGYVKRGLDYAKQGFKSGAQDVADLIDSPATESAAQNTIGAASDWARNNPDSAKTLAGIPNLTAPAYITSGISDAAALAGKGIKAVSDIGTENASNSILRNNQSGTNIPAPPRSYADVKAANDALAANTSEAYGKAHTLGAVLTPEASQAAAATLRSDVGTVDPGLHPKTIGALNIFDRKAEGGLNLETIDNTRKQLGRIAYDSNAGAEDVYAAKQGIKSIDGMLDDIQKNPSILAGGTADSVGAIKDARAASGLQQNHSDIAEIVRQANGNPNAIQSKFKSLFDDKDALKRYAPEEQQAIELLAHPTSLNKILETVGKAGFGGNGSTVPIFESGSAITALAMGNPITAAAIATPVALGTAANTVRARIVRTMTDNLLKNIEGKSVPVEPIDPTLGNRGFSPIAGQKALPAPPIYAPGNVGTAPASPSTLPGGSYIPSPRGASEATAPVVGSQDPASGGFDARDAQLRGSSDLGAFAARNARQPIMPYKNATSTDAVGSSMHSPEYDAATQTLKNLVEGMKRGGAVPTPAQIAEINKKAGRTRVGRRV